MLVLGELYNREEIHGIFSPDTDFTPQAGTWGLHGIVKIPNTQKDFVFIVTYGQSQGDHVFDEGITINGVLSWQSQPRHRLNSPIITQLIDHNENINNIYLFIRANPREKYSFLGPLKYITHDYTRENPVYFQWQLLDWNEIGENVKEKFISDPNADYQNDEVPRDTLLETQIPDTPSRSSRTGVTTTQFRQRKTPDYEQIDRTNRKIGKLGEKLVFEYEKKRLIDEGAAELSEKIEHTSVIVGDGPGYDIKSFNVDGSFRYIEVKTTGGGINTGFFMSRSEVLKSREIKNYYLYRVYNYDADANTGSFYKIPGPVEKSFELTPDNYVVRLLENSIDTIEDCIFCDQSFRNRIFADYVTVFAVKDKYPVTEGHTLIIPYRHCSDYFKMTITEKQHVDELISQIKMNITSEDESVVGFNIGMNSGESAGQTVMHSHIHLIPRRKGDTPNPRGGVRGVIPDKMDY